MSVIKGMNHVALNCHGKEEMDAVLDFYCNTLGFTETSHCYFDGLGHMAMIDTGTGTIELWDNAEKERGDGVFGHLALTVDDADKAVAIFRKAGLPVDAEPADLTLDTEPRLTNPTASRGGCGNTAPSA